jgi:hypothetical protein
VLSSCSKNGIIDVHSETICFGVTSICVNSKTGTVVGCHALRAATIACLKFQFSSISELACATTKSCSVSAS